jgi:hypothetical protein
LASFYGVFQAKFANGGSILSLSQFLQLPKLPYKMKLASIVVKIGSKYSARLQLSKSVKLTVADCDGQVG